MADEEIEDVDIEEEAPVRPAPVRPEAQGTGLVASAWRAQTALERKWAGLGKGRFARVLKMARKPEPEEFQQSAMVVLVGIGVLGLMAFLMYLLIRAVLGLLNVS